MKRIFILATVLTLGLAACDSDDGPVYQTNNMVVSNDADECPRADGQPCK